MSSTQTDERLAAQAATLLAPKFAGAQVTIRLHPRWDRKCITITWPGFEGLLPEERFHRLMQSIPEEFRAERLSGFVWLELCPGEDIETFLRYPRSEDVQDREGEIHRELQRMQFFEALGASLGDNAERSCDSSFRRSVLILEARSVDPNQIQDAKLLFIRHGAFCDCQILAAAQPAMAHLAAGAA